MAVTKVSEGNTWKVFKCSICAMEFLGPLSNLKIEMLPVLEAMANFSPIGLTLLK
jgi:hypothetical protein